jgi:ferritin-like metal-binding protein YciE
VFPTSEHKLQDLELLRGMIRIKGLKIASYNMARSLAETLGSDETMDMIARMLVTEMEGELKLFELAKRVA